MHSSSPSPTSRSDRETFPPVSFDGDVRPDFMPRHRRAPQRQRQRPFTGSYHDDAGRCYRLRADWSIDMPPIAPIRSLHVPSSVRTRRVSGLSFSAGLSSRSTSRSTVMASSAMRSVVPRTVHQRRASCVTISKRSSSPTAISWVIVSPATIPWNRPGRWPYDSRWPAAYCSLLSTYFCPWPVNSQ
jgi:hypothetical protein